MMDGRRSSHHYQHQSRELGEEEEFVAAEEDFSDTCTSQPSCSQGHRLSLILQTKEAGSICLLCFSTLISSTTSLTVHVSYALSQLLQALSHPPFLLSLLTFHAHLLVTPLVRALSSFNDASIASSITEIVLLLCNSPGSTVLGGFVQRISDHLSSGVLEWSRHQAYMLHCLGVLLNIQVDNLYSHIRDKSAFVSNLVGGLRLPSDEIQGEILFVLFKLSTSGCMSEGGKHFHCLYLHFPKILHHSLEALLKTQRDDVRLNCVALLSNLARKGFLETVVECEGIKTVALNDRTRNPSNGLHTSPSFLAEAVKASLLSSDTNVQSSTLDFLFHYLSWEGARQERARVLLEENIADYIFEILRFSECMDPLVVPCLEVLNLLSTDERGFLRRLVIGFSTLIPVLHHVSGIPFHPAQSRLLNLMLCCVTHCPGAIPLSEMEEIASALAKMLKTRAGEKAAMDADTFHTSLSIISAFVHHPSSLDTPTFTSSVIDLSREAVSACLSAFSDSPDLLLPALCLLRELHACLELRDPVIGICRDGILPWFFRSIDGMEEVTVLGVLELLHLVLERGAGSRVMELVDHLVSSSCFGFLFGCLGLFPTEKMKLRVYCMFGLLVGLVSGGDSSGKAVLDAAPHLPSDPLDLLFLLGQKVPHHHQPNPELSLCQTAVLIILETSSMHDARLADDKLVLASLEQYILLNRDHLHSGAISASMASKLINLYALYRGLVMIIHGIDRIPLSTEAERVIFRTISENEWDFYPASFHPTSLKWLFRQQSVIPALGVVLLKVCRRASCQENIDDSDLRCIVEAMAEEGGFGAEILVLMLRRVLEGGAEEEDVVSALWLISSVVTVSPSFSDLLCSRGLCGVLRNVMHWLAQFSSVKSSMDVFILIFKVLRAAKFEAFCDDKAWRILTLEMLDLLLALVSEEGWTREALSVISVLCLIQHRSAACDGPTMGSAAEAVELNLPLATLVRNTIEATCSKGFRDEGGGMVETSLLLLHYFSLKRVGTLSHKSGFSELREGELSISRSIPTPTLLRLMHSGLPLVRLVSSYSLLESCTDLSLPSQSMRSMAAVLEGLVFDGDLSVAVNCGRSLSKLMPWAGTRQWCKVIVEELVACLTAIPGPSSTFPAHHRAAVHVAVGLLRMEEAPAWVGRLFQEPYVDRIIGNLSGLSVTPEVVLLLKEMLRSQLLKPQQIQRICAVFQGCRERIYIENEEKRRKEIQEVVLSPRKPEDDLDNAYEYLIQLLATAKEDNDKLLEEIESFSLYLQ